MCLSLPVADYRLASLMDSPTFKISMREYEDMGIKVGDKVTVEIKKSDNSGV